MPRNRIASMFLKSVEEGDTGLYLVIYDFEGIRGSIPTRFYWNLDYILSRHKGRRVQKSVIECNSFKVAKAIAKLAEHYGATVRVYKVVNLSYANAHDYLDQS
ncbi:MAG: hypothetical protein DRJ49_03675 [Thermoprotei archaeon]|nr:MAG: hypothetical protein DRN53_03215 [Thermoprotei archaeon]RLE89243.1 MAG: hypothetical protein DRJ49_03675 [Thermoprotei archaeon]